MFISLWRVSPNNSSEHEIKNSNSIVENVFNLSNEDLSILDFSKAKLLSYQNHLNNQEIDKALKNIFELLSEANAYVDRQAPWSLKKTDTNRMNVVLSISVELIRRSTFMLSPFIPSSAKKVFSLLNIDPESISFDNIFDLNNFPYKINKPTPIFPRIELNDWLSLSFKFWLFKK